MKNYLISLCAIIVSILSTTIFADNLHYSIVVDAGSSGSRLHLFQYDGSPSVPVIKDIFSDNVKPGISSFADHPQDVCGNTDGSLQKLFVEAAQQLKNNHVDLQDVEINVLGTAGMRLLPADKQQAIYDNIKICVLKNAFSAGEIDTASGQQEGLYAWLDVNYLAQTFQMQKPSVGIIDMGGASTQVAYVVPARKDAKKSSDEIAITLNGQTYHVFSKSFLGLGQDQARFSMDKSEQAGTCYPLDYNNGHYQFATCGSLYSDVLREFQNKNGVIPALPHTPFVAFSGVYYAYNFFGVDQTPDRSIVESHIQTVCNKTWEQLQQDYPKVKKEYLSAYCANGTYIDTLLYGTYQGNGAQLTVTDKLNQQSIDWTLGAMLYRLSGK